MHRWGMICVLAACVPACGGDDEREELAREVEAGLDRVVDPCRDFYHYACGGWLAAHRNYLLLTRFIEANQRSYEVLKAIATEAASRGGDDDTGRMGRLYRGCTDTARIESAGTAPLSELLDRTRMARDPATLLATVAHLHDAGVSAFFSAGVGSSLVRPDVEVFLLAPGGLALPIEHYLAQQQESPAVLAAYVQHVQRMFQLIGEDEGLANAVVNLEADLASFTPSLVELQDWSLSKNEVGFAGLEQSAALPWIEYSNAAGIPHDAPVNIVALAYFAQLTTLLMDANYETVRAYLLWRVLHAYAPDLPRAFRDADFEFFDMRLEGRVTPTPREWHCTYQALWAFGDTMGRAYVERSYDSSRTAMALELITAIENAFALGLDRATWLDETTRSRARAKLDRLGNLLGHPDSWRSYDDVVVLESHVATLIDREHLASQNAKLRIGQPRERDAWRSSPATVNAFYSRTRNQMVFPAAILQPPFLGSNFPAAMRFGAIGYVMGHELTHGFDSGGRIFDADGLVNDWWQPETAARYEERAACVEDLYSTFPAGSSGRVDGALTLDENIADLGGLKYAFAAYRDYAAGHPEEPELIEGLSNDKLFFIAFGQTMCSIKPNELKDLLALSDPHAPEIHRVNGAVMNLPEFGEVFQCSAGANLNPAQRCEVW